MSMLSYRTALVMDQRERRETTFYFLAIFSRQKWDIILPFLKALQAHGSSSDAGPDLWEIATFERFKLLRLLTTLLTLDCKDSVLQTQSDETKVEFRHTGLSKESFSFLAFRAQLQPTDSCSYLSVMVCNSWARISLANSACGLISGIDDLQ